MIAGLGNDIVDLDEAGLPSAGFVERVFCTDERRWSEAHSSPSAPGDGMWAIWAAKETAFKALARQDPALVFSHRRFRVRPGVGLTGCVINGERTVDVQWAIGDGCLSCVGWTGLSTPQVEVLSSVATIKEAEAIAIPLTSRELESVHSRGSRAVRLLAKRACAERLGISIERIEIVRDPRGEPPVGARARRGPPEVWLDGERYRSMLVSLSHDGRFAACAVAAP